MKFEQYWTEEELIDEIRKGNEKAIKTAYKLYFPSIENFVRMNEGSVFEAKDLFQEGFMVLYHHLKNPVFILNCKVKTYLYSVCRRLWLNELKRKAKSTELVDVYEDRYELEETDWEYYQKSETDLETLNRCLQSLGEPCKTLLSDYYLQGMSMYDIAMKAGYTNADNAKTQKYKCLQRLKKLFFESPVYINKR